MAGRAAGPRGRRCHVGTLRLCGAGEARRGVSIGGEPRIVRQVDLQLRPGASDDGERVFRDASLRGTATASGAWRVRAEIVHPRLRCASYQLGLRFGSGDAACEDVDWRTGNDFLPSRTQCNNATLIHSLATAPSICRRRNSAH